MVEESADLAELPVVRELLASDNPVVRYKVRANVLGEAADSPELEGLRRQIGTSTMARRLLSHREPDGTIAAAPYRKWQGPLWTLVSLALIVYPSGDAALLPIRDQAFDWLLCAEHLEFPRTLIIPGQQDRVRRCAGQEAYAVWYTLKLGIADERTDRLVERLKRWQWPDGGWNCDKRPEARISSFHETFMPLRALSLYGRAHGDQEALDAARRAAEVFLTRRLFKRQRDGAIIHPDFTRLTYPYFYHYNILAGLAVMAEAGLIHDERCRDALDLLEAKRLPGGGFPLERRIVKTADEIVTRGSWADWGPVGSRQMNELVTAEALYVLKEAGRLVPTRGQQP